MSDVDHHKPSSHKRRHDDDEGKSKSKKHRKHDKSGKDKKRHHSDKTKKVNVIDDDADEDVWVEKNIDMDGENVSINRIYTLYIV